MRIDSHNRSRGVELKLVTAGGDAKSFAHGKRQLNVLAELSVSHVSVANTTHEIGRELADVRDRQAEHHRLRQLPADPDQPPVDIACVQVDGGRIMSRASGRGRGVHDRAWKEPKVGGLWRMTGATFEDDPHPELPRCFQDREKVRKLMREWHARVRGMDTDEPPAITAEDVTAEGSAPAPPDRPRWQPKSVFRTCVATMRDVHGFGPLVAAEAQKRGFYQARRKVFVADGQDANWTVHRLHFPGFVAVTDFMHAVSYVYQAASAVAAGPDATWRQYAEWATGLWPGQVDRILGELELWQSSHPLPEHVRKITELPEHDPRWIVSEALTYLKNNRARMDYPTYRCQGLPVTSSLIESLIKEVNWRVKGTEKFWNRPDEPKTSRRTSRPVRGQKSALPDHSAESILQVRAALLCDDDRLAKHIQTRPGCPYVRRSSLTSPTAAS